MNFKKKRLDSNINAENVIPVASVAIVGQPNVGKSSLFNRIVKQNVAITSSMSGSTRDIKIRNVLLDKFAISLIDTGGILNLSNIKDIDISNKKIENTKSQEKIASYLKDLISQNSYNALQQSDVILYMVDGSNIASSEDIRNFRILSKLKPTILVLNKVDSDKVLMEYSSEFLAFGTDFITISVAHNRGITKLLSKIQDSIEALKPDIQEKQQEISQDTEEISVGIIGRPNVGKSSLLNALTSKQRSLVSHIAGTTIDPVDESIIYNNHKITFIDTAGIRHRSKISGIEKYALDRTNKILKHCQIAILVLDSSDDFVELDERISSMAHQHELGIIVVLNKWDIKTLDFETIMKTYKRKFKFLEYAPVLTVCATNGRHIKELKDKIIEVYNNFTYRIQTSMLNDCMQKAFIKHPIPSKHGKIIKIYYATQFDSSPPKIALVMNRPDALHFSYKRYLINILRDNFNFSGVPLILEARKK